MSLVSADKKKMTKQETRSILKTLRITVRRASGELDEQIASQTKKSSSIDLLLSSIIIVLTIYKSYIPDLLLKIQLSSIQFHKNSKILWTEEIDIQLYLY